MRAKLGRKRWKTRTCIGKWLKRYFYRRTAGRFNPEDIQCPVCGYYCLGKGGLGCIDKPGFLK